MGSKLPAFRWNIANALTLTRLLLIPFFLGMWLERAPWATLAALAIFLAAAASDLLDGYWARRTRQVTVFGQFADPLVDKLLVSSAWLGFVETGELGAAVVMVLLGREFVVTGLRILAVSQGMVLPASAWGKLKTLTHVLLIVWILAGSYWGWPPGWQLLKLALVWLSVITSLASALEYFYRCRGLFKHPAEPGAEGDFQGN
ncbi:MAG TPA: CDP-diacylglycerol--glycerol-3-phosphate 3-phosphatidyltransferase [Candidatus Bipolaricaulota bacterium]